MLCPPRQSSLIPSVGRTAMFCPLSSPEGTHCFWVTLISCFALVALSFRKWAF